MKILHSLPKNNFAGLEEELTDYKKARVIVFPVPYDSTASVKAGQREGPQAIINASRYLSLYDEETKTNVSKKGIFTTDFLEPNRGNVEENNKRIQKVVTQLLEDKKFVVTLGGDHSITTGVLNAFKEKFSFTLLHLDAHSDAFEEYEGSAFSHACVAFNALKQCDKVVQVGIRSTSEEELKLNEENVFLMKDLRKNFEENLEKIIEKLGDKVYVSLDLDVLDSSVMPAVGTPEPGGLTYEELLSLLRKVCEKREVIGFDCVELMPLPGNDAPNYTAAKIVYKFLSYSFVD
ncbi:MAG: agmatinase [Candidatus Micrarchaeota archaeon]